MNIKSNNVQVLFVSLSLFFIGLVKYFGFGAPYFSYYPMFHKVRFPEAFPSDIAFQDGYLLTTSIYYKIITFLNVQIENDIIGIILHFISVILLCYVFAKLFMNVLNVDTLQNALLGVLVASFLHAQFVDGTKPSVISILNFATPTGMAFTFGMLAFACMLLRKNFAAAILVLLTIALRPKGEMLLVPIFGLLLFVNKETPRRELLFFLIPFAYVIFKGVSALPNTMTFDQKVEMVQYILGREEEDGSFLYQSILSHVGFWFSLIASLFLARKFSDSIVRSMSYVLAFVFGGAYFFEQLYHSVLYKIVPALIVPMLSIPQNTKYLALFCAMMMIALCLKSEKLYWYEKLAILLAIILGKAFPMQVAMCGVLLIGAIAVPRLAERFLGWKPIDWFGVRHIARIPFVIIAAGVTVLLVIPRISVTYAGPLWIDSIAYKHIGSWSSDVWANEDAWTSWNELSKIKADFNLLAIYHNEPLSTGKPFLAVPYRTHFSANVEANKSNFYNIPFHGYLNYDLFFELERREVVTHLIFNNLNSGKSFTDIRPGSVVNKKGEVPIEIPETIAEFLSARNVGILIPEELYALFPQDLPNKVIAGKHRLVWFGEAKLWDEINLAYAQAN